MFAKVIPVEFNGEVYHLAFNAWAMFEISDLSEEKQIMEILLDARADAFPLFCKAAEIMSRAAENIRSYEGLEKGDVLTEAQLVTLAGPMEILKLKRAMAEAVARGYERELGEEKTEVDLGLYELEKKTNQSEPNICP